MNLLFVVPRFGAEIVGGAERLVYELATRGVSADDTVEIATTCAVDHHTWTNQLPAGTSSVGDLTVHRFAVGERDTARHGVLAQRLHRDGRVSYLEELEFLSNDVWSPDLQRFLEIEGDRFDAILFAPYLFGTTFWGAQVQPDRTILIPCLHDEPYAYMESMQRMFASVAGCLFNTSAEMELANRLYGTNVGHVVGMGFDPVPGEPQERPSGDSPYFVYMGRLEEAKGVHLAVEHFTRFAAGRQDAPRLVLVGAGPYEPPRGATFVETVGWVDEAEKTRILGGAVALVQPSKLESLSIVLMEAWRLGVPALVSAGSTVLTDHCSTSGGGFAFADDLDFAVAAAKLLDDHELNRAMGRAGRAYVENRYAWSAVARRFQEAVAAICDTPSSELEQRS